MCSAKEFYSSKGLFYKALLCLEALQKRLLQRDDGSHTPDELRLYAMLDALCYAPCCVARNAREAIFTDSLTSKLVDLLCVDYLAQVTTPWLV